LALTERRGSHSRVVQRARRAVRHALSLVVGADLRTSQFGEHLFIPHPYGVVVHASAVIGDRCTIYQGVTVGEDNVRPGVPTIGDDVVIGAGAAVLGPVHVGDGARIGANAVVLRDVPSRSGTIDPATDERLQRAHHLEIVGPWPGRGRHRPSRHGRPRALARARAASSAWPQPRSRAATARRRTCIPTRTSRSMS
jgi:serine O-acetyltransferase